MNTIEQAHEAFNAAVEAQKSLPTRPATADEVAASLFGPMLGGFDVCADDAEFDRLEAVKRTAINFVRDNSPVEYFDPQ